MSRTGDILKSAKLTEYEHRPACSRIHHTMVSYKKCLYLYGGVEADSGAVQQNVLWKYSLEKMRWTCVGGEVVGKKYIRREGHSAVVWKGSMYVYGGHRGVGFYGDMQAFDFESLKWRRVVPAKSSAVVSPRFGHAAAVAGDRMWVAGGFLRDDTPSLLLSFSFSWKTWCHHPSPPSARCNANTQPTLVHRNSRLYLIGIYQEPARSLDVAIFDLSTESWVEISCTGVRPDAFHPMGGYFANPTYHPKTDKLYVFAPSGRRHNSTGLENTVSCVAYCFDFTAMVWKYARFDGFKPPRVVPTSPFDSKFVTVLSGDRIYFHGGTSCEYYFAALTPSVEVMLEPSPPQSFASRKKSARSDDETFTVAFSKELQPPATAHLSSTTPVVRLSTAEEVRQWQETAYLYQKKWLTDQWGGGKADETRRKEATKAKDDVAKPRKAPRPPAALPPMDVVTSQSSDKDILSWKMGGSIIVPRKEACLATDGVRHTVEPPKAKKGTKLWSGLRRVMTSAVLFKGRVYAADDPTRAAAPSTAISSPVSLKNAVLHPDPDPKASIAEYLPELASIGNVPPPPVGAALERAVHASSLSHDPHIVL